MEWLAFDLLRSLGASCGEAGGKVGQESERFAAAPCGPPDCHGAQDTPTCTNTDALMYGRKSVSPTGNIKKVIYSCSKLLLTAEASALGCRKQRQGKEVGQKKKERDIEKGCAKAKQH